MDEMSEEMSKDFRVTVRVQNAHLYRAIMDAGYESVAAFCRDAGMNDSRVSEFLSMKLSPIGKDGDWRPMVRQMSEWLGPLPEELFPDHLPVLKRSTAIAYMSSDEVERLIDTKRVAELALSMMTPREAYVARRRANGDTLDEIAASEGVTPTRIRQIDMKARRRVRGGWGFYKEEKGKWMAEMAGVAELEPLDRGDL